jgi:hypothetical protein
MATTSNRDRLARVAQRDEERPGTVGTDPASGTAAVSNSAVQRLLASGHRPGAAPAGVLDSASNAAMGRLLAGGISSPQDRAEREADQVGRQVATMSESSGFQPSEFGGVRFHTDQNADRLSRQVGARAFTTGRDVYFRAGEYRPHTASGRGLIAHELTHVGQQDATPGRSPIQRAPATDTGGPQGTVADGGADWVTLGLERMRAEATGRTLKLGNYTMRSLRLIDQAKGRMVGFSETYRVAYEEYADVMRAAERNARELQEWVDIFSGIAIGVGVGLLAEGIVAGAVLNAVIGESIEAVVGKIVIPEVAGQDLEPGGIHPGILRSRSWETLATMYRTTAQVQKTGWHLPLLLGNTEYALGQWRLINAGADADLTRAEVLDLAASLVEVNGQLRALDREIDMRLGPLEAASARVASAAGYPLPQLKQDVWIVWMADLPAERSDDLDANDITDHLHDIGVLGPGSVLGVDFGWWTSEDDELAAIAAARGEAVRIRERFKAINGGG